MLNALLYPVTLNANGVPEPIDASPPGGAISTWKAVIIANNTAYAAQVNGAGDNIQNAPVIQAYTQDAYPYNNVRGPLIISFIGDATGPVPTSPSVTVTFTDNPNVDFQGKTYPSPLAAQNFNITTDTITTQGAFDLLNPGGTAVTSSAPGYITTVTPAALTKSYNTIIAVYIPATGTGLPAYIVAEDGSDGPRFVGPFGSTSVYGLVGYQAIVAFANNVGDVITITMVWRGAGTGTLYLYGVTGAQIPPTRGDGRTCPIGSLSLTNTYVPSGTNTLLTGVGYGRYLIKSLFCQIPSADQMVVEATIDSMPAYIAGAGFGNGTDRSDWGPEGLLLDVDGGIAVYASVVGGIFNVIYDIVG